MQGCRWGKSICAKSRVLFSCEENVPDNSCEEHQQNGCWKTAAATTVAITSITQWMPLMIGISAELPPLQ